MANSNKSAVMARSVWLAVCLGQLTALGGDFLIQPC
jgi:hypothetical protein